MKKKIRAGHNSSWKLKWHKIFFIFIFVILFCSFMFIFSLFLCLHLILNTMINTRHSLIYTKFQSFSSVMPVNKKDGILLYSGYDFKSILSVFTGDEKLKWREAILMSKSQKIQTLSWCLNKFESILWNKYSIIEFVQYTHKSFILGSKSLMKYISPRIMRIFSLPKPQQIIENCC